MGQDFRADASGHAGLKEKFRAQVTRAERVLSTGVYLETFSLIGLGIAFALVLALAIVILSANPSLRYLAIALGALTAVSSLFFAWHRARKLLSSRENTAQRLEEGARQMGLEMGDRVRSAVGLLETNTTRSKALANAHIAQVAKDLEKSKAQSALFRVATLRALPLVAALLLVVAGVIAFKSKAPALWERGIARLVGEKSAAGYTAPLRNPIATDIDLTLRYPAYMGLADQEILGGSGDIVAPKGTLVLLRAKSAQPVKAASLSLGEQPIALSVEGERALSGSFTIDKEGAYRFKLTYLSGKSELDPVAHSITLKRDAVPKVVMNTPEEDRVVQLDDTVVVQFEAEDDFGLSKVRLNIHRQQSGADPYFKEVAQFDVGPKSHRAGASFTIRELGARAGDRLTLTVEAFDNNSVEGAQVGRSMARVLTVFSEKEHHRRLIEAQERALAALVTVLGDELEYAVPQKGDGDEDKLKKLKDHTRIDVKMGDAMQAVEAMRALADKDELTPKPVRRALKNMESDLRKHSAKRAEAFESARNTLVEKRPLLAFAHARIERVLSKLIVRLETHVLYLDDLINQERIREVKVLAEDIKRSQQELKELLTKFKNSPNDETKKALMNEIQRMREQLREMMKRMSKLQQEIPDEYLNEEAFKSKEMLEESKSIEELIQEGKLDEAEKMLEEMIEQSEKMLEQLDKTSEEFGGEEYKELNKEVDKFAKELEAIEAEQKELLERSENLLEAARQKAEQAMQKDLKKKLSALLKKAEEAQKQLDGAETGTMFQGEREDFEIAKARAKSTKEALKMGDIEDALEAVSEASAAARAAERSLRDRTRSRYGNKDKDLKDAYARSQNARPKLEEIEDELRDMLPDPRKMLNEQQKQAMKKDAKRQQKLSERAQKLVEQMKKINKEAPIFNPGHEQAIDDASAQMRKAGRELKREGLRKGKGHQEQAMQGIEGLKKAMQGSKGKGQGGMPMPLPNFGEEGDEEGDGQRSKNDRVEIPKEDAYKVPDQFRKDILDAMREGAPGDWEKEVRRYYEELVK